MFNFENLNLRRTVKEGIDTNEMEFRPLKDYYGEQVVVVGETTLINMPKRAVEQFKQIASDEDAVKAVLDGHLIIDEIKMAETKNGTTTIYKLKNA